MTIASFDWVELSWLLDTALSLTPRAREQWLAGLGLEHVALKGLLSDLLTRQDLSESGDFLARLPEIESVTPMPHAAAAPGDMVGPYLLERLIGSGGMGSVWLAMRADGLLQRKVALKLPHLGAPTRGLVERMARERNILAVLEHPNIARLYDAGITSESLSYLALEYVEGEPIDTYCRNHGLDLRARLELIIQVARAVAYAHAHLIVHRDLKPSNIVVDREGKVRLLDFGIAALLNESDAELQLADTSLTRQIGGAWTAHYASPEQVRGEPVSTSTDVYSLGVVLYELLTGRWPYELKRGDFLGTANTILTTEPPAPSRISENASVSRKLQGDLDVIALKSLKKDVSQRYATMAEFADDIERHLRGEPVHAQADSLAYRAAKFARRNRIATISGALIAASLCLGMVATLWQAQRARFEEQAAKAAQARAEQRFNDVRQLAHSLLFDYHDAIKDLPGATPVRARLVQDALKYLDSLAKESAGEPALQSELATAYERVGNIQGGTMFANLGDTRGALESEERALALRRQIVTSAPEDYDAKKDLALSYRTVGILEWETGDMQSALSQVDKALQILDPIAGKPSAPDGLRGELAKTHDYIGRILADKGDAKEAQDHYATSIGLFEELLRADPTNQQLLRSLSVMREQVGTAFMLTGDLNDALASHQEALKLREQLSAAAPLNADYQRTIAVSLYNIGEVLSALGRTRDALESYRRDAVVAEKLFTADPANDEYRGDVSYSHIRIGDMLDKLGRPTEALRDYNRSLAMLEEGVRNDPSNLWKRSSLIEAHTKISRVLVRPNPAQAAVEARAARNLMGSTDLDPENAAIQSFFATTYADLADIYAALAKDAGMQSHARWLTARDMHGQAEEIWRALEHRGALSSDDRARRARAQTTTADVETHLQKTATQSGHGP